MVHLLPVLGNTVVLLMHCLALFLSPSHRTREDTGQNVSESEAGACHALKSVFDKLKQFAAISQINS